MAARSREDHERTERAKDKIARAVSEYEARQR
jgi:hypothetical protein